MYNLKGYIGFALFCITVICFLIFNSYSLTGNDNISIDFLNYLTVPLITVFYLLFVTPKKKLFLSFLTFYSLGNIICLIADVIILNKYFELMQVDFYIANGLYMIAYIYIILIIVKPVNFKAVIKDFKIYIIVLGLLDIYLLYFIFSLITHSFESTSVYIVELTYNTTLVILLSLAALRYFYNDDKKALYLFIGTLFIVFAEVSSFAFINIESKILLKLLPPILAALAFYFFWQQSKLLDTHRE